MPTIPAPDLESAEIAEIASMPTAHAEPPPVGAARPSAGRAARPPELKGDSNATLVEIREELRGMRRERQMEDFSIGRMAGAVAQAFALCAIAWALYAAISDDVNGAVIRFLAAITFQLVALTWFSSGRHK